MDTLTTPQPLAVTDMRQAPVDELRQHLAAYLLATYGAGETSPVTTGEFWTLSWNGGDRYALQLGKILSRRARLGTTGDALKQALQDAADLEAASVEVA